jgi:hypothetical protein
VVLSWKPYNFPLPNWDKAILYFAALSTSLILDWKLYLSSHHCTVSTSLKSMGMTFTSNLISFYRIIKFLSFPCPIMDTIKLKRIYKKNSPGITWNVEHLFQINEKENKSDFSYSIVNLPRDLQTKNLGGRGGVGNTILF